MEYQVIVPNLERRTDRWLTCLGVLLGQGVPPDRIIRFCAHDGKDYDTVQQAKEDALSQYDSNYLRNRSPHVASRFCWQWTYYSILHAIANGVVDSSIPSMILVDEVVILATTFDLIRDQLKHLSHRDALLRIVQYNISAFGDTMFPLKDLKPVNGLPGFQHGIGGMGDRATVFTPAGAGHFSSFLDTNATCAGQNPEQNYWYFAHEADQAGCYSTSSYRCADWKIPYVDNTQDRTGEVPKPPSRIESEGRFQYMVRND